MNLDEAKKILFRDKELRKVREKNRLKYQTADLVFEARLRKKMTQAQLAKKIGTEQPSIARIENGDILPSLEMLQKIAKALRTELLQPRFEFMEGKEIEFKTGKARSGVVISTTVLGYNFTVCHEFEDSSYANNIPIRTFVNS